MQYSREIDSIDTEILLLITNGYSSPYAVWSAMKKVVKEKYPPGKKSMAYINVNKRITELAKMELLDEVKPDAYTVNIHGRKDYKVTLKGLERLLPHMVTHPQDVKAMNEYMDNFGLNKQRLGQVWVSWIVSTLAATSEYVSPISRFASASLSMNINQIEQLRESIAEFHEKLLEVEATLRDLESKQVVKSKSKTGHDIKITTMDIRDGHSEYGEQLQKRLLKGEPEIADRELEENLYRLEKSKSTRINPIPAKRSKSASAVSQKKKH